MILQPLTGGTNQATQSGRTKILPPLSSLKTTPISKEIKKSKSVVSKPNIKNPSNVQKAATGAFNFLAEVGKAEVEVAKSAASVFQNLQKAVTKVATKKPKKDEGLGAPLGRALQKVPDVNLGTKFQKTFKATDTETKIVNFISNFPSAIAQSYGRSLETLSTPEGKKQLKQGAKNLPKTMNQVKTLIDKKEWQKALETAFSNPAISVALDVSDFIPVSLITKKLVTAGSKTLLKKIVKEGIEEGGEKVVKEATEKAAQKTLSSVLTPQAARNKVFQEGIENTKLGRKVITDSFDAQAQGKNLQIEGNKVNLIDPDTAPKVQEPTAITKPSEKQLTASQELLVSHESAPEAKTIAQYKADIQAGKPVEPLKVIREGEKYGIEDGKHRFQAYKELGIKDIPIEIVEAPKPKVKIVSVPRQQLPVGEGAEKLSRLEARITKSLDNAPDEVKNLSTYQQMTKKDQIASAVKYVNENPDEALAVLRGEKEAPKGLLNNSIYVAMQNASEGNVELARRLASLSSTRFGQELSILTEIDPNSPVKAMSDIVKIREEAFRKKYGGKSVKEVSDTIVKDIKKKVKPVDKYDWSHFVKSLPTC